MKYIETPFLRDENIHIGKMIHALFKYKHYFVIAFFAAILSTALVLIFIPKKYRIEGRLQLISSSAGLGTELKALQSTAFGGMLGGASSGTNSDDQSRIMLSRRILTESIITNQLQVTISGWDGWRKTVLYGDNTPFDFDFSTNFLESFPDPISIKVTQKKNETTAIIASESIEKATYKFQSLPASISTPWGNITLKKGSAWNENFTTDIEITPLSLAFEMYESSLTARPTDATSDLLEIITFEPNRQRGISLVNSLMNNYITYTKSIKLLESSINEKFIEEKLQLITDELNQLEKDIELYKRQNNIPDMSAYGSLTYLGSEETYKRLLEFQIQTRLLEDAINYLQDPKNEYAIAPSVDYGGDAMAAYNRLMFDRMKLLESSNPSNPAILGINTQLSEQRKVLIITLLEARKNLNITIDGINKENAKYMARLNELPSQEKEFIEMKRVQKTKESLYLFLLQKKQEKELANAPDEQSARILDPAYSFYKHISPKGTITLIVSFILWLTIAFLAAAVKEFALKKTISNSNLPNLLSIKPWNTFSNIESIQRLSRFICNSKTPKGVFLITSSIPGEGKTFFTTQIMNSLQEHSKAVLLSIENTENDADKILKRISDMQTSYDYIFVKAPSLKESSIAYEIASHADYTFFLCRIEFTQKENIAELDKDIYYETLGKVAVLVNQN